MDNIYVFSVHIFDSKTWAIVAVVRGHEKAADIYQSLAAKYGDVKYDTVSSDMVFLDDV